MKLLSFRLQGKMAHFRRYYSNSSALTYSIPPRTTIVGILSGLLGLERDSYYEIFSLDQCHIAVSNRSPIKKQIQKLNLLMIKNANDFNGSKEYHSQTPTEFILPQNIRTGIIDYQVWVSHRNPDIMRRLVEMLRVPSAGFKSYGISLALGQACHLGWLRFEGEWEGESQYDSAEVEIFSAIPVKYMKKLEIPRDMSCLYRLVKEDLPLEFNQERRLTERGKGEMIINLFPSPIRATVTNYVKLSNDIAITWME